MLPPSLSTGWLHPAFLWTTYVARPAQDSPPFATPAWSSPRPACLLLARLSGSSCPYAGFSWWGRISSCRHVPVSSTSSIRFVALVTVTAIHTVMCNGEISTSGRVMSRLCCRGCFEPHRSNCHIIGGMELGACFLRSSFAPTIPPFNCA